MLASYKWLKELCAFEATPDQVAEHFTGAGLEVERQKHYGQLPHVVVAEVRSKAPHPKSDKLTLVSVFDGERELSVVCGAPNVPEAGERVLFARVGASLPNGLVIAERKVAGVSSHGMICSETELEIGAEADGIVVLGAELKAAPGTLVSEALGLDDVVFELGVTPNRPDCLGHLGLARELSALLGAELRSPTATARDQQTLLTPTPAGMRPVPLSHAERVAPAAAGVPVRIEAPERCARYAAATVEDVEIGPSPFWLRYRLHVLGHRPINNAVDVTNLVLLEYGYPTHAFDLDLVQGGAIDVRVARPGEQIDALDGLSHALAADDLLICDAAGPIAIAGVIGGQRTSVQARTRRIVVECAYFDPRSVRRSSRRLGLHTDASHRFERGVDPRAVPAVLARVVSLLAELSKGRPASTGFEVSSQRFEPREIRLREARAEALLGVAPPAGKAREVLAALGCEVDGSEPGSLRVRVPSWRPDLTREEDLIEEVARIWGYAQIPSVVPALKASQGGAAEPRFLRRLRERAAAVGLTEVINYAFVSPKQLEKARVPTAALRLANPLSEERSVMRTSLLPGLLANVQRAQRHQVVSTSIYELARTFAPTGEILPEERNKLGIALSGTRGGTLGAREALDFFDAKGLLASIVEPLSRGPIECVAAADISDERPYFHPRRSARVWLFGVEIGALGEIHPDVLADLELTGPVLYAELDVASLIAQSRGHLPPQLRPLPRFPASSRDLAIVVDEAVEAGTVAALLREKGGVLVEDVQLFDLYRGGQLEPGKKSLAFRIRYRDRDTTLTDQRVEEAHGRVTMEAERYFGAQIRA